MKVVYDEETNSLMITFRSDRIKESDEVSPGVIADLGYDGGVVRLEILDASRRMDDPRVVEFAQAG